MEQTVPDTMPRAGSAAERAMGGRKRPISTKAHGAIHYSVAPVMAFAPEVLGFPKRGAAAASIVYSSMTEYELGVYPGVKGVFLAASRWLLLNDSRSTKLRAGRVRV